MRWIFDNLCPSPTVFMILLYHKLQFLVFIQNTEIDKLIKIFFSLPNSLKKIKNFLPKAQWKAFNILLKKKMFYYNFLKCYELIYIERNIYFKIGM